MNAYQYRDDFTLDVNFNALKAAMPFHHANLVFFLGAGASVGAKNSPPTPPSDALTTALGPAALNPLPIPAARELRDEIYKGFIKTPALNDLGMMSLEHVSALAEEVAGSGKLRAFLSARFFADKTLWPHVVMATLKPKAIFTTNYDELIELGWSAAFPGGLQPVLVQDPSLVIPIYRTPLYKPHGSITPGPLVLGQNQLVITQIDYFSMHASRMDLLRSFLQMHSTSCFIFVGYSFFDSDLGSLIYEIRQMQIQSNAVTPWFAVFPRNPSDFWYVRNLYKNHFRVDHIDMTFFELMSELAKLPEFAACVPPSWRPEAIAQLITSQQIQDGVLETPDSGIAPATHTATA